MDGMTTRVQAPVEAISYIVTPELATAWLASYHYAGQRQFKDWHRNNLARMMREGCFRPKTQIAFVRVRDRFYLTNGQHTLSAIVTSGLSQELSIVINVGADLNDVADDFSRHDTHLTRRFGDSLVAHGVHESLGVPITALHAITAACSFYALITGETNTKAANLTHDDKLAIVNRHGELGVEAWNLFEGRQNKTYLTRKTTLASAMVCLSGHDSAREFWIPLAMDDGLRQGDPRKTLLDWLRSRTTPGGSYGKIANPGKIATDHELVKACASAWNSWVAGKELKIIRVNFEATDATFDNIGSYIVRRGKPSAHRK